MISVPFQLGQVHSYLVLAFGVLIIVALVHVRVASGEPRMNRGWNDWSRYWGSPPLLVSSPSSPALLLPLWSRSQSSIASDQSSEGSIHPHSVKFVGKYASLRAALDYSYHSHYSETRQLFQDRIIDSMLNGTWIQDADGRVCPTSANPWIVFTAGAMGAGKSFTIRQLAEKKHFPLKSFVRVDPDDVRRHFPEYQFFAERHPEQAGEWTRKEAGHVAEILTQAALQQGYNVLVDGSLRNAGWYKQYFADLRKTHPYLRIGILHVTAPREAVFQRAKDRSKETGRVVPQATLELAIKQVPESVKTLAPLSDFFCSLHNPPGADEVTISTEGLKWEGFRRAWAQKCPRPEHRRKAL